MVHNSLLLDEFNDENIDLSEIYTEIKLDDNHNKNNDNSIDDDFYDIITEGNIIPDIKIEVEDDENNEKVVKFSLSIIINEDTNETITIDLNITKKTYLMIAEELFK